MVAPEETPVEGRDEDQDRQKEEKQAKENAFRQSARAETV
jgi:hypothetical protein